MDDLELLKRLLDHIDEQALVIESLQEYIMALECSIRMRKVSMRLEMPPPG